jgi:hypothetical protein
VFSSNSGDFLIWRVFRSCSLFVFEADGLIQQKEEDEQNETDYGSDGIPRHAHMCKSKRSNLQVESKHPVRFSNWDGSDAGG